MGQVGSRSILRNTVAGAAGGLVASFAMNQFQSLWKLAAHQLGAKQQQSSGDDATVKTADALTKETAGHSLEPDDKKPAGAVVHYLYGTTVGALYGALAGVLPVVAIGAGTAFGAAAWLGGDEIAVPALGFAPPSNETPASAHISTLAAHMVYGAVTHLIFSALTHDSH